MDISLLLQQVGRARKARRWRGLSTKPAAVVWTVNSWGMRNSPGPYPPPRGQPGGGGDGSSEGEGGRGVVLVLVLVVV